MATATGTFVRDFSGLGDQNPYTPIGATLVEGQFQILGGELSIPAATTSGIIFPQTVLSGNLVATEAEVGFGGGDGVTFALWIGDATYTFGYRLAVVSGSVSYMRVYENGTDNGSISTNPNLGGFVAGDRIKFEYNTTDNKLRVYKNDGIIDTSLSGVSVVADNELNSGFLILSSSNLNNGIVSLGVTGYADPGNVATISTTLVADISDTPLAAAVDVDVTVFTAANVLVGTGTINVGTNGAVNITEANLTLEAGQTLDDATTYRVDFQESTGDRQRSVDLVAAV